MIVHESWRVKVAAQTTAEFRIRNYRPADLERLWSIDQRCFVTGISYDKDELQSFIDRRNAITLVAEFQRDEVAGAPLPQDPNDNIAGFVVAHCIRRRYGRVITLDIVPEARRCGLGSRLMYACEEGLRSVGCSQVYLETAVDNEPALRLYRTLGYEVLRTLPEYYGSHSLDAFEMGKRL